MTSVDGMRRVDNFIIPKESGRAFEVSPGQILRVIEIEGGQACDFNAWVLPDLQEYFSAGRTRFFTGIHPRKGDSLWSNPPHDRKLFTILEDTVGHNDLLFPRCSAVVFEPFGVYGHRGCQDILQEAIASRGLTPDDVHDAFNLFTTSGVDGSGFIYIDLPRGKQGDYMDLLCHVDCLVALSACPAGDVHATNAGINKPLGVELYAAPDDE